MADVYENEMQQVYVASLLRCLDADRNSKVIDPFSLIGHLFQEKGDVIKGLDNYTETGMYGLNRDIFDSGLHEVIYGMLIVFGGKSLAQGGSPVIQIAIGTNNNPYIWLRTSWLNSWTNWKKIIFTI